MNSGIGRMSSGQNENSFRVDLHGVVELLSDHLYSGPQVFLRELLQNAVDASTLATNDDSVQRDIRFRVFEAGGRPALAVTDTGVGLTADDAVEFMSVIGRSSKRDEIGMARETLIGQFGVGILSCFTVSEVITVDSKSERSNEPIRWTGRADGTWNVEPGPEDTAFGSTVTLVARPGEDKYFEPAYVIRHVAAYGELLPHRVWVDVDGATPVLVSRDQAALHDPLAEGSATLALGRELLEMEPLDFFAVHSVTGRTVGVAYVVPHEVRMTSERGDRVYVKGMLVSASTDRVLPPWAFFVRCVLLADGLRPTASREELHDDDILAETRNELGDSIKTELVALAGDSRRLSRLVKVHHQALKALAVDDPDFLRLVADWLPMETSVGNVTLGGFARAFPIATYTRTVDEFRQLAPIASSQGIGLVCGGYTHDFDLIEAADRALDGFSAQEVKTEDLFGGFGPLDAAERERTEPLVTMSRAWFDRFDVELMVRRFEPLETPALVAVDDDTVRLRTLRRSQEESNPLFSSILETMNAASDGRPILCLNAGNPIVARLVGLAADDDDDDEEEEEEEPPTAGLIRRALEVLYLQALLMGHHPLSLEESALLNSSLTGLLDYATGRGL